MTWLATHWRPVLIAAGLAGAFGAGWLAHRPPPQPAVSLKQDTATQKASATDTVRKDTKGPETVVRKTFRTDCPAGSQPAIASETTIRRGPEVIDTARATQSSEAAKAHTDLTVTPQARAGWALQAGMDDVLGARPIRIELRRRLFGPIWLGASAVPSRTQLGASLSMEW